MIPFAFQEDFTAQVRANLRAAPIVVNESMERYRGECRQLALSIATDESVEQYRSEWRQLIEKKLMRWFREPSLLEDIEIDVPTKSVFEISLNLANRLMNDGIAPPTSISPDPNGGIVFERRSKDVSEVYHVWDDETVEYMQFKDNRMVERFELADPHQEMAVGPEFGLVESVQTQALSPSGLTPRSHYSTPSALAAGLVLAAGTFCQ